jgi:cytochrome b pre-mRNA-processing protein 3
LNPFTPFKASNPDAAKLYGAIVAQARLPVFYQALEVPDTLEGRFLVLSLHLFAVHRRLRAEGEPARGLAQDLADRFSADMDTVLREIGVGDLSVPKKVRKVAAAHAALLEDLSAPSRRAMRPSPPLSQVGFPRTNAKAGLQACSSRTM